MLAIATLTGCGEGAEQGDPEDLDGQQEEQTEEPATPGKTPSKIDAGTGKTTPPSSSPGTTPPASKPPTRNDAGTVTPVSPTPVLDGAVAPNPFAPGDRTPSPDNIKECPPVAPENPIGSCLGVPVYAVCAYTTYTCVCDWYHWLCI